MTETTQPDPQVVAWMRGYLRDNPPPTTYGSGNKATALRTYVQAHSPSGTIGGTGFGLRDLADAYDEATRKPLTVADIPAGQGRASLYIGPGHRGELAVMYRTGLTHDHVFMTEGPDDPTDARRAMWDHLAATLPHVTTEETQP